MVCLTVLLVLTSAAAADVYVWQDEHGTRHFTNRRDAVPAQFESLVIVQEREAIAEPEPVPERAEPEPRREVQVVSDRSVWQEGYIEGLREGLQAQADPHVSQGGHVEIQGPLAVARAQAPSSPAPVYVIDPYFFPTPLLTTSFDRGRSRHLTLRLLLQDQFRLDREGPFVYFEEPLEHGPDFRIFLRRGLTHPMLRGGRVVVR